MKRIVIVTFTDDDTWNDIADFYELINDYFVIYNNEAGFNESVAHFHKDYVKSIYLMPEGRIDEN